MADPEAGHAPFAGHAPQHLVDRPPLDGDEVGRHAVMQEPCVSKSRRQLHHRRQSGLRGSSALSRRRPTLGGAAVRSRTGDERVEDVRLRRPRRSLHAPETSWLLGAGIAALGLLSGCQPALTPPAASEPTAGIAEYRADTVGVIRSIENETGVQRYRLEDGRTLTFEIGSSPMFTNASGGDLLLIGSRPTPFMATASGPGTTAQSQPCFATTGHAFDHGAEVAIESIDQGTYPASGLLVVPKAPGWTLTTGLEADGRIIARWICLDEQGRATGPG